MGERSVLASLLRANHGLALLTGCPAHAAERAVAIASSLVRPGQPALSWVESAPQLLRRAAPIALRHELGDFVPVGVVVQHHPDGSGRPRWLVERWPGMSQSHQLAAG